MSSNQFGASSSSFGASSASSGQNKEPVVPRRLDLTVNPEDGSLLTAPLTHVLLSATDALYTDLYNASHGDLDVVTTSQAQQADDNEGGGDNANKNAAGEGGGGDGSQQQHNVAFAQQLTKKERMSNLSFAQRRHELQWRLFQHGKSLQHVAALTAAHASSDIGNVVEVSSRALQHARTAWMQADEAQDALYFFHAQLFPSRASPLDVYGSCDVMLSGNWYDLPRDLQLQVDRYPSSREGTWPKSEVDAQWQLAVRQKLVKGEVGYNKRKQQQLQRKEQSAANDDTTNNNNKKSTRSKTKPLFHLSLRGGILKLTHGHPKRKGDEIQYPIEALLTVLSSSASSAVTTTTTTSASKNATTTDLPEWTMLSLEVRCESKTGEFNHQLETSNRQRYNLHRLAALSMAREESRARQLQKEQEEGQGAGESPSIIPPARPLHVLFTVAHTFLLSWQLELLGAQAQALRRGVWAATGSTTTARHPTLTVTPVKFFDEPKATADDTGDAAEDDGSYMIGALSVSFWKVDDSYGPPSMGDLIFVDDDENDGSNAGNNTNSNDRGPNSQQQKYGSVKNQLTLSVRAESNKGIVVSLSGATSLLEASHNDPHSQSIVRDILKATCHPLALSVSDALLAATRLCAISKSHSVAEALRPTLPSWVSIEAERGSLAIAARVKYYYGNNQDNQDGDTSHRGMSVLFRLECDARTGSFVCVFARPLHLLRKLACNSSEASEPVSLRMANLPAHRRHRAAAMGSTGRYVSNAFDGLIRSFNLLGQRTGVGGSWDDIDDRSALLRSRAVQSACNDVSISLSKCCGLAALYGLFPLALGSALGLDAVADMAGEAIDSKELRFGNAAGDGSGATHSIPFLPVPPVGILLDQDLIETATGTSDGAQKKTSYLNQTLFAATCSADKDHGLTLYPLDIRIRLDSPAALPQRTRSTLTVFNSPVESKPSPSPTQQGQQGAVEMNGNHNDQPPAKRQKVVNNNGSNGSSQFAVIEDIMEEAGWFAQILACTVDPD